MNPYESPIGDTNLASKPGRPKLGILRWLLIVILLPTPFVGGAIGLVLGLAIGFRFFEVNNGPPLPDISETGQWVVLACAGLGFAIPAAMAGFGIWRILSPALAQE
jgi:hypothetical protein